MNARNERGFTLLEIVIALAILSMIMGVAYQSLSQILRSKRLLDDQRDGTFIADAVLSRMTREFQLASFQRGITLLPPPDAPTNQAGPTVALLGEEQSLGQGTRGDSITFLAMEAGQYLPDGGSHSGLVQIRYRVVEDQGSAMNDEGTNDGDPETYYLVRDEIPYIRPPEQAYKKVMTFPVTNRLTSLTFEYYDQEKEAWTSSWGEDNRGKAPLLIRFSLSTKSPNGEITTYTTAVPIRSES